MMDGSAPTVLWRLWRDGGTEARAVLIPGEPRSTLTILVNEVMDRAENFDDMDVALFRAEDLRVAMVAGGWRDEPASS